MQEAIFYQCRLSRGIEKTVGWIPERGAIVGAQVELLEFGKELWKVDEVFNTPMTQTQLSDKQRRDRGSLSSLVGA